MRTAKETHTGKDDTTASLAAKALQILCAAYERYTRDFAAITARASDRFEQRQTIDMRRDTVKRLDLYPQRVRDTQVALAACLGAHQRDPSLWMAVKDQFARFGQYRCDAELALTFFNSVNRKIFQTVGIQPQLEFVAPETAPGMFSQPPELVDTITVERVTGSTVRRILLSYGFKTRFYDLDGDARLCAERIRMLQAADPHAGGPVRIHMLRQPFFRDAGAYLIGSMQWQDRRLPLVFAIVNRNRGLAVDALLLKKEQLRILFSFSRDYFHVATPCPQRLVSFLKQLMPEKRTAELYIALGHHKHGKTEIYRELLAHQQVCSQDRFDFAPGQRGMVMIAFNMPQDNLIYKIIRDRFDSPKQTTRRQVMERYDYVFKHDRAGRLLDVQTFENLQIEQCCFSPALLDELGHQATRAADMDSQQVVLRHVFVERRVTPLDVFLKHAGHQEAKAAVIDYGNAIKDLARVNVFAGDMLIKNFGVTRLGRIVFYDYDELCPLLDCNFRWLPQSRYEEEELSAEPWFSVAANDVFPEEFASFLGLPSDLRQVFIRYHADLLTPEYWQRTQERIRSGRLDPIMPYTQAQRLRPMLPGTPPC
jgi:isocitrate dehydrogenase kinase/phosphatase